MSEASIEIYKLNDSLLPCFQLSFINFNRLYSSYSHLSLSKVEQSTIAYGNPPRISNSS